MIESERGRNSHSHRQQLSAPPYVPPSTKRERDVARDNLLRILSNSLNPQTNKRYTNSELAIMLHMDKELVDKTLPAPKVFENTVPKLEHIKPPENEAAFFRGLALGNWTRKYVENGHERIVVIGTESPDPKKRNLLTQTLGKKGLVMGERKMRVYLSSPEYDFIVDPRLTKDFLRSKERFSAFLFGALAARISEKGRFSLSKEDDIRKIDYMFTEYYGYRLGSIDVRSHAGKYRPQIVPAIEIEDRAKVFQTLRSADSVKSLPFLSSITTLH